MSQFQDIFPSNYRGKKKRKSRADSDEYYVIDLCDEVLGRKASRQHRFDFLTGDTGKRLPVDAYYEDLNLVVEYYERQHSEPIPYWDKKMTASGVTREKQRKIYDERREIVLPQHGIKLIIINYYDFGTSKRIIRNKAYDIKIVRNKLKEFLPKTKSQSKKKDKIPLNTENTADVLEVVSKPQKEISENTITPQKQKKANVRDYSIEQRCIILSKYMYNENSGVIYRTADEDEEYFNGITIFPTPIQLNNEFNLLSCKQLKDSANIKDFNDAQKAEITEAGYEYDFLSGEIYRTNEDFEDDDDDEINDLYVLGYIPNRIYKKDMYIFPTTEQLYKELNLQELESKKPSGTTLKTSEKIWRYLNKKIFVLNYEITLLNSIIFLQVCTIISLFSTFYLNEIITNFLWTIVMIAIIYIQIRNSSIRLGLLLTASICFTIIFIGLLIGLLI